MEQRGWQRSATDDTGSTYCTEAPPQTHPCTAAYCTVQNQAVYSHPRLVAFSAMSVAGVRFCALEAMRIAPAAFAAFSCSNAVTTLLLNDTFYFRHGQLVLPGLENGMLMHAMTVPRAACVPAMM